MTSLLHWEPRAMLPDLSDWFESPFMTLRPHLTQAIRVEDYFEDNHYVLRAELAGIEPDKDVEITVGSGYLTIRAERSDKTEGKRRTEFRYGSFTRTVPLPVSANEEDVKAMYHDGILTIMIGMKEEKKQSAKKIPIATGK
ncbi:MAG TPA: Hsp20/alpha crystallin family protein [Streptosporangiaceae bacterium]|nr:Hsp20/alpha crystallin family protein [Streptosporangiaceae bacterium]